MADDLDEIDTQIPSKLLTDSSINSDNNQAINRIGSFTEHAFNWFSSSGSSSSGLSTPRESEIGSTETESEDDDFIAELTRQMADYMLKEDDESSRTPAHGHGPTLATALVKKPTTGFYSSQALTDHHNHSQMKNKEFVKQHGSVCWGSRGKMTESTQQREPKQLQNLESNRGRVCGFGIGGRIHPQQVGSGMRAIFLGGSDSRNGSSGTGVFLPRGTGSPVETRKKTRCSTVLIPVRVMQALQLHYDNMNALSRSNGCPSLNGGHPQRTDTVMGEKKGMHAQVQKRQSESPTQPVIDHQEIGLPNEWAY